MSDSLLELWWDRNVIEHRQEMYPQRQLPHDGASWVMMVNFFGVVGMADPRIKVSWVNPLPVMDKMLEIWPKRQTWKDIVDATKKPTSLV